MIIAWFFKEKYLPLMKMVILWTAQTTHKYAEFGFIWFSTHLLGIRKMLQVMHRCWCVREDIRCLSHDNGHIYSLVFSTRTVAMTANEFLTWLSDMNRMLIYSIRWCHWSRGGRSWHTRLMFFSLCYSHLWHHVLVLSFYLIKDE